MKNILGPLSSALLALFLPLSAAAQGPEPSPSGNQGHEGAPDGRGRDLKRVLHLRDGSLLRGRSRWSGETWEVRSGGEWRALPPRSVERAVLEREVLAEARRLADALQPGAPQEWGQRVTLADWMLRHGLAEEALAELDRVLAAEPDHPHALALLASPPVPLRVFSNESDPALLLRRAAGSPPAASELAVLRLAECADPGALRDLLREALSSHSLRMRSLAALGMRRLFPGEELRPLVTRAVLDGSDEVRRQASLALAAADEPAVILPAVRAMYSSHATVRENAVEALGWMGYPAAVEPLVARLSSLRSAVQAGGSYAPPRSHIFVGKQTAYIQDFDVEVAQGSAIADPIVNTLVEGSVLDVRVIGVTVYSYASESRRIRASLRQLTGLDHGDNEAWIQWWEQSKHRWLGTPAEPQGPKTPAE